MNVLDRSKTFAYADDTAIVVAHQNIENAKQIMQHQLNMATRWCHDHGLVINASKTKLMHIKPPHIMYTDIQLKYHETKCLHKNKLNDLICNSSQCPTTIELVNTYKYLGVHVDNNFTWNIHIDEVRKKLRKAAYMLYQLKNCSSIAVLRQAYYSLVESHIRHGITAWGNSKRCRILQETQNKLLKILKKSSTKTIQINNTTTQTATIDLNNITPNNGNHMNILTGNNSASNNHQTNSTNNASTNNNINNNTNNNTNNIYNTAIAINNSNNSRNNPATISVNNNYKKIATEEHILNVKSIYYTTMATEFYNDTRFLKKIEHKYNTRRKADGRYSVQIYKNNYGKSTLNVMLPTIFNMMPPDIINTTNTNKIKKLIKKTFMNLQ